MTTSKAKQVLPVLDGIEGLTYDPKSFKKSRRRDGECPGSCYYGTDYFNPVDVQCNVPDLQLTKGGVRGRVRFDGDLFSVWILPFVDLQTMARRTVNYIVDWTFYSYVRVGEELVIVFPQNRSQFGSRLAEVARTHQILSCSPHLLR